MKYGIRVMPEAEANIAAAYSYIAERSPANAATWVRGLYEQIDRLQMFPRRFGAAREAERFSEELRPLVYKSYRIIFTIDDAARLVRVVYVRHAKRLAIGELPEEAEDE